MAVEGEVRADVDGKAVEGDAAADLDADGRYFSSGGPNTGEALLGVGGDVEIVQDVYYDLLQDADVLERAAAPLFKVDDGVANELAGSVVCDLTATVRFVHGDADGGQFILRGQEMLVAAQPAAGEDVGVLEEKEGVGRLAVVDSINQLGLQFTSSKVFDRLQAR